MDDTDRGLLMLISRDVRIPPRDIAEELGISRQAVQKRLKALRSNGVFGKISACVSWSYLNAIPLLVFGKSSRDSATTSLDKLGDSELTIHAIAAGGDHLYVSGMLRRIDELDRYVEFVRRTAEMPSPTVGIFALHAGIMPDDRDGPVRTADDGTLTPLDLRIIGALRGDVRRPIEEIAKDVGVSPKTVSRHLDRMVSGGAIEYNVPWDLLPGEDMFTLIQVRLKEGVDQVVTGRRLYSRYKNDTLWVRSFSNLPGFLLCTLSSGSMAEVRSVLEVIRRDTDVLSATPNTLYEERTYLHWRDELTSA